MDGSKEVQATVISTEENPEIEIIIVNGYVIQINVTTKEIEWGYLEDCLFFEAPPEI